MVPTDRPRSGPDLARRTPGAARGNRSPRFAGLGLRPDEKFLAAHDRESVARGTGPGAGLRAAAKCQRRDGAGDRFGDVDPRSVAAFGRTGSARGKAARETFAQPGCLSS